MLKPSHLTQSILSIVLIAGLALPASARSIILAREAAMAILETSAGKNLARELGISVGNANGATTSASQVNAFLKALDKNPALRTQLANKSQQFINMADKGSDYTAISSKLELQTTRSNSMASALKVKATNNSIRTAARQRAKNDPQVDASLARQTMQAVSNANKKLGGGKFLKEGFAKCLKTFKAKAVNNANKLALSGAQEIVSTAKAGINSPIKLLNAGTREMISSYARIFSVQIAEAKQSICTLASRQCKLWNTGQVCL